MTDFHAMPRAIAEAWAVWCETKTIGDMTKKGGE